MRIDTIARLIEVLTLQKANLPTYQVQVGATAADITRVNEHLKILIELADHCELYDANKRTAFGIKDQVFRGVEGEPVAPVPTTPAFVPPFPPVSGILSITNSANRRFREGPDYDNEIGIALGIASDPTTPTNPTTLQSTIELFAAQSGAMFSVVVGNRSTKSPCWPVRWRCTGCMRRPTSCWRTGHVYRN